jgi:hypothetical protein
MCDYENENLTSLSVHYRKKHKGTAKQLCIELFHDGIQPTCKCGCGKATKFWTLQLGFAKYLRGHVARVHNNWGHNEDAQKKSQDVRRDMHKRGEIFIWNKGLSIETDDRVAAYGRSGSHTLKTDAACQKQRSEHMSTQWKLGCIVPLRGADHSQWRGGTSALQPVVRSRLHYAWAYPKLAASGFKCSSCGRSDTLEVHHDGERFADILHKAIIELGESGDDFEKKSIIADWVVKYHVENDISGVVLCQHCHDSAHNS